MIVDFETTKQLLFEVLKTNYLNSTRSVQMGSLMHDVYNLALSKGILKDAGVTYLGGHSPLPEENVEHVLDMVNALLQQGVLRWGLDRAESKSAIYVNNIIREKSIDKYRRNS